jgi:hypothetical protein
MCAILMIKLRSAGEISGPVPLYITTVKWTRRGSKRDLCGDRSVTKSLSQGTDLWRRKSVWIISKDSICTSQRTDCARWSLLGWCSNRKIIAVFCDNHLKHIYVLHGAESFLRSLTGLKLLKKFPAFYGTRKFDTAFTRARHLFLSWARLIHSIPLHPTCWRSILIPSQLCLGLPSGLLPLGFPTKTLYAPLLSPVRAACPAYLSLHDLVTRMVPFLFLKTQSFVISKLLLNVVNTEFLKG